MSAFFMENPLKSYTHITVSCSKPSFFSSSNPSSNSFTHNFCVSSNTLVATSCFINVTNTTGLPNTSLSFINTAFPVFPSSITDGAFKLSLEKFSSLQVWYFTIFFSAASPSNFRSRTNQSTISFSTPEISSE